MHVLNLDWAIVLGPPILAVHLLSVTLTRALRMYSPSRLEERCQRLGRPARADDVARHDQRTERASETLAVVTGLMLSAMLGVAADRAVPQLASEAVVAIALTVAMLGYVLAGVVGRVFAEPIIDVLWSIALPLRVVTAPLTYTTRQIEAVVESLASQEDATPRPTSVEVEIPADADHPVDADTELPESTRELFTNAVELTRRDVSELMTPHSLMVMLPSTVSPQAAGQAFRETGLSRIPLYGENRDDILGILYAKDLFPRLTEASDPSKVKPRNLVRRAFFIPETKNAYDLLAEFRENRTQIAIVLDEYGAVTGLITLEDLLEELVGEIDDEHDVRSSKEMFVHLGGSRYEVDAKFYLELLNERLGLRLPTDADFQTLGGFAFHALGHFPEVGATFRQDGIEFQILEVADHSIRRVLIDLQPEAAVGTGQS